MNYILKIPTLVYQEQIRFFGLKWFHMGRYELILRLDGALWLTIIFKPLLTPQRAITIQVESYFA